MMRAYDSPSGNSSEDIRALRRLIADTRGRIFIALFVSRVFNTPRRMRARLKRTTPETVARDLRNHQFTVWDMEKHAYRTIPLERIVVFQCGAERFVTSVGGAS